jgi:hypothetical protein
VEGAGGGGVGEVGFDGEAFGGLPGEGGVEVFEIGLGAVPILFGFGALEADAGGEFAVDEDEAVIEDEGVIEGKGVVEGEGVLRAGGGGFFAEAADGGGEGGVGAVEVGFFGDVLMLRGAHVAQAAKPADEAKPRPVRKKTNTRRRMTSKAGDAVE